MLRFAITGVLLMAAALRGEDERVAELIKALDNDQFEVREKAQRELIEYAKSSPDIWAIGEMILKARVTTNKEVGNRLNQALAELSIVHQYIGGWGGTPSNEVKSNIWKTPLFIAVNTSAGMMTYYRRVAQEGTMQRLPSVDFSKEMLLGIATTGIDRTAGHDLVQILQHDFRRDFRDRRLTCDLTLAFGQSDGPNGPTTPGECGLDYKLSLNSPPITIIARGPEKDSKPQVVWRYEKIDADWKNVETVIKDRNIYAYRKLAEKLDAAVPIDKRRSFLKDTYMADPLLPYVMFTNMARNHPELFKEDYQFWKANLPDDHVLKKLFDAALEEGFNLVKSRR